VILTGASAPVPILATVDVDRWLRPFAEPARRNAISWRDDLAKSRPSVQKRQNEMARQQKRMDKDARKAIAKERKAQGRDVPEGVDPDLVGLRFGQPLPPELGGVPYEAPE